MENNKQRSPKRMSKRREENKLDERKNKDVNFPLIVGQQTVKEPGVKTVHVWAGGAYRGERLRQRCKGKTSEKYRGVREQEPRGLSAAREVLMMLSQ